MGQFTAFPVHGVPIQPRFQTLTFTPVIYMDKNTLTVTSKMEIWGFMGTPQSFSRTTRLPGGADPAAERESGQPGRCNRPSACSLPPAASVEGK